MNLWWMNFIGDHWFFWLMSMILFLGLIIYNQLEHMKNKQIATTKTSSYWGDFFSEVGAVAISVFSACVSGILLVMSIVINVFQ